MQRTALDNAPQQQQQQQQQQQPQGQVSHIQQQQQAGSGPHSHPLSDSSLNSSSSSSYRSSSWVLKRVRQLLQGCQRVLLKGVGAVADRLNWW
jgi:hypothetical protein